MYFKLETKGHYANIHLARVERSCQVRWLQFTGAHEAVRHKGIPESDGPAAADISDAAAAAAADGSSATASGKGRAKPSVKQLPEWLAKLGVDEEGLDWRVSPPVVWF